MPHALLFVGIVSAVAGSLVAAMAGHALTSLCMATLAAVTPDDFWTAWSFAPEIIVPLALLPLAYLSLCRAEHDVANRPFRHLCFTAGFLLLVLALVSPLCRLSSHLAVAHMIQHATLVLLAPPLLLVAVPPSTRAKWTPGLDRLPLGAALYGALIWIWHLPGPYEWALRDPAWHLALYASLLGASVWFWAQILAVGAARDDAPGAREQYPINRDRFGDRLIGLNCSSLMTLEHLDRTCGRQGDSVRSDDALGPMTAMIVILLTIVHTGLLGALLVLSATPWYASATGGPRWGLSPLEDQHLAGLVMWVPMAGAYMAIALAILARQISPHRQPG